MNTATLEINPDLKIQLDHLAEESHRSGSDLANEAVAFILRNSGAFLRAYMKDWRKPNVAGS